MKLVASIVFSVLVVFSWWWYLEEAGVGGFRSTNKTHWGGGTSAPMRYYSHSSYYVPIPTVPPPPPTKYSHDEEYLQTHSIKFQCVYDDTAHHMNASLRRRDISSSDVAATHRILHDVIRVNEYCPPIHFPMRLLENSLIMSQQHDIATGITTFLFEQTFCNHSCYFGMTVQLHSTKYVANTTLKEVGKHRPSSSSSKCICFRSGGERKEIVSGLKGKCNYPITRTTSSSSSLSELYSILPMIATHSVTSLQFVQTISKFRSSHGHDSSDCFEECRSMKHYVCPYPIDRKNKHVPVFMPFTSVIVSLTCESPECASTLMDHSIYFCSVTHNFLCGRFYHVDIGSNREGQAMLHVGDIVNAGTLVGHGQFHYSHRHGACFDIQLEMIYNNSITRQVEKRFISIFQIMTRDALQPYHVWSPREVIKGNELQSFILSKNFRDSAPLKCLGSKFLVKNREEEIVKSAVMWDCEHSNINRMNSKCWFENRQGK